MRTRVLFLSCALGLFIGAALTAQERKPGFGPPGAKPAAGGFVDEFDGPKSVMNWTRLSKVEPSIHDPFGKVDAGETGKGHLTIVPSPNAWYEDFQGGLLFRTVRGDFDVTADVTVSGLKGAELPASQFSLAGLLVRSPKPDRENLVFLALGVTDKPGRVQVQSMNTRNGGSEIRRSEIATNPGKLRILRSGASLALLVWGSNEWQVLTRLNRPDLPPEVQVGLMASTDWAACQRAGATVHNRSGVTGGAPDLVAQFDRVRIAPLAAGLAVGTLDDQALTAALKDSSAGSPKPAAVSRTTPAPASNPVPAGTENGDDLKGLSDEFDDEKTLSQWQQVFEVEKTGANQLEKIDISQTRRGWMVMVPYTSSWYRDHRGVLVFKTVRGDFIATTKVRTERRSGSGAPQRTFSLAGIMVRTPRDVTPSTWRPGGENYIFLSHGAADRAGQYQLEVKTTVNSNSQLQITPAAGAEIEIRVARIGEDFLLLRRAPGQSWAVHRRYHRPDMPAELQVGMTVYTDWPNVERVPAETHNRTVIRNGQPDLVAGFDYFRFGRPSIPEALKGRRLSDAPAVPDGDVLRFLGAAADQGSRKDAE